MIENNNTLNNFIENDNNFTIIPYINQLITTVKNKKNLTVLILSLIKHILMFLYIYCTYGLPISFNYFIPCVILFSCTTNLIIITIILIKLLKK